MTSDNTRCQRGRSALAVVVVALAYAAGGWLGVRLAIPPGYATVVWPSSGIALAAVLAYGPRIWPGIVLGSFLVNVWTGFDAGTASALLLSLGLPAGIGLGAALQAVAGAALVRRFGGFPSALDETRSVARLMGLGGVVASVVAASVGVALLWLCGRIPAAAVVSHWAVWWGGDCLGVFVFTPVALAWIDPVRERWAGRRFLITLWLGAMFGLSALLEAWVLRLEHSAVEAAFAEEVVPMAIRLDKTLVGYLDTVRAIEGLYGSAEGRGQGEFSLFASRMMSHAPGLEALAWVRRDTSSTPDAYVVDLVEPVLHGRARGGDLGGDPVRRAALEQARDTGSLSVSGRITLMENQAEDGVLAAMPVYRRGQAADTLGGRRAALEGFALGVLRPDELVHTAFGTHDLAGVAFWLVDRSATGDEDRLAANTAGKPPPDARRFELPVGGRTWVLYTAPTAAFAARMGPSSSWMVLAGSLLFTALVGAFVMVAGGREAALRRKVAERTEALAESEARYREMFQGCAASELLIDPVDGGIVDANPAAAAFYGYPVARLQRMSLSDLSPSGGVGMDIGEHGRLSVQHRLASGEFRDVEVYAGPVRVAGRLLLYCIVHDVTDRRRIERSLEQRTRLLTRHYDSLRALNVIASLPRAAVDGPLAEAVDLAARHLTLSCGALLQARDGGWRVEHGTCGEPSPAMCRAAAAALAAGDVVELVPPEAGLAVPVSVRDVPWGVAIFATVGVRSFDEVDFDFMRLFGLWAGTELERDGATTELRRTKDEAEAARRRTDLFLSSAGEGIVAVDDKGVVTFINPAARRMLGWAEGEGLGYNLHGMTHHSHADGTFYHLASCPIVKTLQSGQPCQVSDDVFWRKDGAAFPVEFTATALMEGERVAGAVTIFRDITERKLLEARIENMALFDGLTGLPNRFYLEEALQRMAAAAVRRREVVVLLYLDLDGFKEVNDAHGHAEGDALLKKVASRLGACVRSEDVVARLGGDEFVVATMVPSARAEAAGCELGRRIIDELGAPVDLDCGTVTVGASVGMSIFPKWGERIEECVSMADAAMYRAKRAGKGQLAMACEGEGGSSR